MPNLKKISRNQIKEPGFIASPGYSLPRYAAQSSFLYNKLDTLAQPVTNRSKTTDFVSKKQKNAVEKAKLESCQLRASLSEAGFSFVAEKLISKNDWKKAKKKERGVVLAEIMLKICNRNEVKSYTNMRKCTLYKSIKGGKVTSTYCNHRLCPTCSGIRMAKALNQLEGELMCMEGKQHVILTVPNVYAGKIRSTVQRMGKALLDIRRKINKRRKEEDKYNRLLSGLRSIEVTFNSERYLKRQAAYHPHLHLIVGDLLGTEIVDEWLKIFPDAVEWAQKVITLDKNNTEHSLKELLKYVTSPFYKHEDDLNKIDVHAQATLRIVRATKGLRMKQTFGDLHKVDSGTYEHFLSEKGEIISEDIDDLQSQHVEGLHTDLSKILVWKKTEQIADWVWVGNHKHCLCGNTPTKIQYNSIIYQPFLDDDPRINKLNDINKRFNFSVVPITDIIRREMRELDESLLREMRARKAQLNNPVEVKKTRRAKRVKVVGNDLFDKLPF